MKTTHPPKPLNFNQWQAHIRRELKKTPCPDWSETKKQLPQQQITLNN